MDSLITTASQILEYELNLKPEKSICYLYQVGAWHEFRRSRGNPPFAQGTYLPRTLSAHLLEDTEFLQLNLIHEYDGHGIFCEHNAIGQTFHKYEIELSEIEKEILCVETLPENQKITIDERNPYFTQYVKLNKEFRSYYLANKEKYEGFALWLEDHLSYRLNLQELWFRKMSFLTPDYILFFNQFKKNVDKEGIKFTLEMIGFGIA